MSKSTLALFQTFGHDVPNIVHVSIGGFVICVEQCFTMSCLAGTAQYVLMRRIMDHNCQLWRMGMIHDVLKAFCTRKVRKLRGGQNIHLRKLKSYLSHT